MPYKRKQSARTRSKKPRVLRIKYKKRSAIVHPRKQPFPAHMDLVMEWMSPFTLTDNSGTTSNQLQVVLNNVYQTYNDVTGTTWSNEKQVSAQFLDQMQLIYDAYTVYKCQVEAVINNNDTNAIMCAVCTANTADAETTAMKVSDMASRPYSSVLTLTPASGSKSMARFKRTYWMNKLNGYTSLAKYLEDSGNINPTNTANTTQSQFLTFSFGKLGSDAKTTTGTVSGYIKCRYFVRWRDREPIIDQANLG